MQYAREHHFPNPTFFVDDGVSGVTYDRPGFQAMLAEIEAGRVAVAIAKDLSRLGRNSALTGLYTNFTFPQNGVRFIAINDNYDTIDPTYSNLLSLLTLCPTHQSALKERGLKSEEMERLCYRTTPTTRLKRIVTELLERGCILDGVPGFYCQKDSGQWVLDIRGSGIMLPDRNLLGQIEAIQVRLDKVYNQKFYNLTSVDQYYGTQSKCCPHYVGVHEGDEVVCLTEGVMKSDLAYSFAQGSPYECGFVGLTGIPSYSQYERALEELDSIGVKRINVMVDSDYQVKEEVRKARDRYIEMGAAAGFEMAPITWTQKQKGVDDLYRHLFRDK